MSDSFSLLSQTQPGITTTTVYTSPAATQTIIKHIKAVNTTALAVTLTLYQSGSAATNLILPAASIPASGWAEFDGNILMAAGDTLQAKAGSATAITLSIYGLGSS